jgi:hypothetical protein
MVSREHGKRPWCVRDPFHQGGQIGAVMGQAFSSASLAMQCHHLVPTMVVQLDFEGPFVLKETTCLFATRFAHAPTVVFMPCELTRVPCDFLPAVGDAQGRVGRRAEVEDVKEGPRRTSLHQRLLGF